MSRLNPDLLLQWYYRNKRDLPWRNTTDPYKIWISEVMLQQTRVDTVISYYERFTEAFPTVSDLASANRQHVLKLWEGLGYYSRARNLHEAANTIVSDYNGSLPGTIGEIQKLKGIGPYTSAAILSIAYGKKFAVVDGNVVRVITRILGVDDDIRKASTRNLVRQYVDETIPEKHPGDFNQAVMELGATVCKPVNPECSACPVSHRCIAFNSAKTSTIPYKSPAKKIPHHHIAAGLIVDSDSRILVSLRPDHKMLGGLWELPGGKQENDESLEEALKRELHEELGVRITVFKKFRQLKHAYSHFRITLHVFWCRIDEGVPQPLASAALQWVTVEEMNELPFPAANKRVLHELTGFSDDQLLKAVDL